MRLRTSRHVLAPPAARPIRRHLFYIPGYADAGPERHHALFAREAALFARLWDVETAVSALEPEDAGAHAAVWRATTRVGSRTVETVVEVMRWDDLVAADFRTPLVVKLYHGLAALADAVVSGALLRVAQAAPWFAFAWVYPYLGLLLCACAGAAAGALAALAVGPLAGVGIGVAAAFAALAGLRRTPLFVVHLLDDWIAQRRFRRRADPALDARLGGFAVRLAEVVSGSDADEVLVVGHSSGSFLAIDVVARAFEADPALGRRGVPLSLLTLGAAELLIALHPKARWFRDRIARLAAEPTLFWAEVAGRWDTLCFPERGPVAELGQNGLAGGSNPHFVRVALRRLLTPATVRRLARGLKVFRIHFQYVMANELRGPYDFFALACGAPSVRQQFARPKNEAMTPFPAADAKAPGLQGV